MINSSKLNFFNVTIDLNNNIYNFILYSLFFLSGISALIYQVMWERMLFTLFGVDLQSTTIIVSVFMFGLGMGSFIGGLLADQFKKLLMLYVLAELFIALFGFISPILIKYIGHLSIYNEWMTITFSFLILAFPTILMGATFPILVTYLNRFYHNIGHSVGGLYFANTIGGAMGAYYSGFVLLHSMGIIAAIYCSAFLNLAIALCALLIFRKR